MKFITLALIGALGFLAPTVASAQSAPIYGEVVGGGNTTGNGVAGARVGLVVNQSLDVEGEWNHTFVPSFDGTRFPPRVADQVSVDGVLSSPSISVASWQPYVLAGAGYRFSQVNEPTWTVGAGLRRPVFGNLGLDLRYERVSGFTTHQNDNQFTVGFAFKF